MKTKLTMTMLLVGMVTLLVSIMLLAMDNSAMAYTGTVERSLSESMQFEVSTLSEPARFESDLVAQTTFTSTWTTVRINESRTFSIGYFGQRNLALDAGGYPHIVYGGDNLYYAWYDGATWHDQVVDPDWNAAVGDGAAIALDANDTPHIIYLDNTNTTLRYAYWTGTDWTVETVARGVNDEVPFSLVVDANARPHISYVDSQAEDLLYASLVGGVWVTHTVDFSPWCLGTSIAVKSDNTPCIAYEKSSGIEEIRYACLTGGSWVTETVDTEGVYNVSLAIDQNDHPHISYSDYDYNEGLKYARRTESAWTQDVVVLNGGTNRSIAVDSSNQPHIVYSFENDVGFGYAYWTGSAWVTRTVDTVGAWDASLVLDGNDRPHISYIASGSDLKYAHWTDSTWAIETLDHSNRGYGQISFDLDANGNAHASYQDWNGYQLGYASFDGSRWNLDSTGDYCSSGDSGNSLGVDKNGMPHTSYIGSSGYDLQYAWLDSSTWFSSTTVDNGCMYGATSLALSNADSPRISYYIVSSPGGSNVLKYAWLDNSIWYSQTIDSGLSFYGGNPSLALDSADSPHIAYYDDTRNVLKYAWMNSSSWYSETVDGNVGEWQGNARLSLALDSTEYPQISYYDAGNGDLKYARWTGSAWVTETVDSNGDVGQYSSLALDEQDHPHIGYYDATNDDLKYAWHDGTTWHIEIVDSTGNVGRSASLVLDSNDHPFIAYLDSTNDDLKFAWRTLSRSISPAGGQVGGYGSTQFSFPAGAVTDTVVLTYTLVEPFGTDPHAGIFYDVSAVYQGSGSPAQIAPGQSYTVVIHYDESALPYGVSESDLALYYWDGADWVKEPTSVVDTVENTITATPDHFSVWAALVVQDPEYKVYLPAVLKNYPSLP